MTTNTEPENYLKKMRLEAVLAEYNDLRDEAKRRIDHRTHISYFVITIILGAFGLYITSKNPWVLILIPSIVMYWLFIIDSSYFHHLDIVRYIREKIEGEKLPLLIGKANDKEGWLNWETYYFDKKKVHSSRFRIYIFLGWIILLICGLIFLYIILQSLPLLYLIPYGVYWILYGLPMRHFYLRYKEYQKERQRDSSN